MTNMITAVGTGRATLNARPSNSISLPDVFLYMLQFALVCYALLGRGFAGTALGPIYIGDALLLFGLLITGLSSGWSRLLSLPLSWLLLAYLAWGAIRTVPYISVYGRDAFRDGVIWAYGILSLLVAVICIARPHRIERLIKAYGRYVIVFATIGTVGYILQQVLADALPLFPGTPFLVISLRTGEALVQCAGIFAFVLLGLRRGWIPILLMAPMIAIASITSRGASLALMSTLAVLMIVGPNRRNAWRLFGIIIVSVISILFFLAITGLNLPFTDRSLSPEQLIENLTSIFQSSNISDLTTTSSWRLFWWQQLISDAFTPEYFLAGKGYGFNLTGALPADDYGVEAGLRSPHNFHLNILARAGIVGFILWVALQVSWVMMIYRNHRRAIALGLMQWQRFFLWLLAWWAAFMVNASFDVFLEGPMGAMWFWTMFGVGLAGLWIFEHRRNEIFAT